MSQPAVVSLTIFLLATSHVFRFCPMINGSLKESSHGPSMPVLCFLYIGPTRWGARRLAQYDSLKNMIRIFFWTEAMVIILFLQCNHCFEHNFLNCLFVGPVFFRGKQLPGCNIMWNFFRLPLTPLPPAPPQEIRALRNRGLFKGTWNFPWQYSTNTWNVSYAASYVHARSRCNADWSGVAFEMGRMDLWWSSPKLSNTTSFL